jgi:hypothetical protein
MVAKRWWTGTGLFLFKSRHLAGFLAGFSFLNQ